MRYCSLQIYSIGIFPGLHHKNCVQVPHPDLAGGRLSLSRGYPIPSQGIPYPDLAGGYPSWAIRLPSWLGWAGGGGGGLAHPWPLGYPILAGGRECYPRMGCPLLGTGVPPERTWDQWKYYGMEMGYPLPWVWTDTHLWKQYLPHPSDAGGRNGIRD